MFDPTIVKAKPRVVRSSTGMYVFEGAYSGRMQFFGNRILEDAFETVNAVREASDVASFTLADPVPKSQAVVTEWSRDVPETLRELLLPVGTAKRSSINLLVPEDETERQSFEQLRIALSEIKNRSGSDVPEDLWITLWNEWVARRRPQTNAFAYRLERSPSARDWLKLLSK